MGLQRAGYLQSRAEGNMCCRRAASGYPVLLSASAACTKPGRAKGFRFGEIARVFFQENVQPGPEVHAGRPDPRSWMLQKRLGKVDGNAVEQLNTSTTEKKEILKDSVEALVLKKRIREELQRKDQLVSHNAKEKKVTTDADTGGSEKQQKKIDARANTLANEDDKPIEDEPMEGGVPAQEEKSAEHQRQHHERHKSVSEERRAEDDVNDVNDVNDDDKKSSSSKKHKNKASGKPEVWDSDY